MYSEKIKKELKNYSSPKKAKNLVRFFKTGKGQYGEGDIFIGVTVPEIRLVAKKYYKNISLKELKKIISSKIHEERLCALEILVFKYEFEKKQKNKYKFLTFYLNNKKHINNWDLVDISAPYILGPEILKLEKNFLNKMAKSKKIWEKRIAIVSTLHLIRNNNFLKTIEVSEILLKDEHDLINKAVGWMLREVGKRNEKILIDFIEKNKKNMSRTTLRYAIERFPKLVRNKFLL